MEKAKQEGWLGGCKRDIDRAEKFSRMFKIPGKGYWEIKI